MANIVIRIRSVDESGGIRGDEGVAIAVSIAKAVVDEATGFFPFAVGSVVAAAGADFTLADSVGGVGAMPGHGAAGGELGHDVAAGVVEWIVGAACGVLGVELAADSAANVVGPRAVVECSVPLVDWAAAAECELVGDGRCGRDAVSFREQTFTGSRHRIAADQKGYHQKENGMISNQGGDYFEIGFALKAQNPSILRRHHQSSRASHGYSII